MSCTNAAIQLRTTKTFNIDLQKCIQDLTHTVGQKDELFDSVQKTVNFSFQYLMLLCSYWYWYVLNHTKELP